MKIHLIVLCIAVFFTICFLYALSLRKQDKQEGFSDSDSDSVPDTSNALVSLVSQLKRISGYVTDRNVWSERLEMYSMSPVELARRHLNKQLHT